MTNKDYYFLSKLAKAEKTIKQATVTTCTHKALTPTEPVAPTLGESDKIMYGQGSVAKTAANDGDRSGAITDAIIDRIYSNTPGVNAIHGAGQLLGISGFGSDRSPNSSIASIVPGVAGYNTVQRRRQIDRKRSGGKRDRSAQLHELAGSITNSLLLSLLGAGIGAGAGYLSSSEDATNRERMQNLGLGALMGGIGGAGTGLLAQGAGSLIGLLAANKKDREEYLKNSGMWKNYLIPGYAGYQSGAGLSDAIANS